MKVKKKAIQIRQMFSEIAGKYDLLNSLLSFRQDRGWRGFAVSKCNLLNTGWALDVGTGTGEMALLLAKQYRECKVVGIDFSPDMLTRARGKLLGSLEGERIQLIPCDALRLPFPDSTFDCVTIGFALRNVADIAAAFSEIARVLKLGGRVVSVELTRPSWLLVRSIYDFYICHIVSRIGGLISGNMKAYTYLPESILKFPHPEQVKQIMEAAGLQQVEIYRLTFGAATVHVGTR